MLVAGASNTAGESLPRTHPDLCPSLHTALIRNALGASSKQGPIAHPNPLSERTQEFSVALSRKALVSPFLGTARWTSQPSIRQSIEGIEGQSGT